MTQRAIWARGDRRSVTRHSVAGASLPALVMAGVRPWTAAVDNISPCGMAVRLSRPVDLGTRLPVELLNRGRNCWHLKVMSVVHVTPYGEGEWLVGNIFLARFTDDEFRVLLPGTGLSIA